MNQSSTTAGRPTDWRNWQWDIILPLLLAVGLVVLIAARVPTPPATGFDIYRVSIDYRLTQEELVVAGKYDFVSDRGLQRFTLDTSGPAVVDIKLFPAPAEMKEPDAIAGKALLAQQGFRPATARELLVLSAKYPALLKGKSIVALDAVRDTTTTHSLVLVAEAPGKAGLPRLDVCGAGILCLRENIVFAGVPLTP